MDISLLSQSYHTSLSRSCFSLQVNGVDPSILDANANAAPTTEIDLSDAAPEDVTFTTDKARAAGNTAFNNPLYGTAKPQVVQPVLLYRSPSLYFKLQYHNVAVVVMLFQYS